MSEQTPSSPSVPVEPDLDPALPDDEEPDDTPEPVETDGPAAGDGEPQDEVPA